MKPPDTGSTAHGKAKLPTHDEIKARIGAMDDMAYEHGRSFIAAEYGVRTVFLDRIRNELFPASKKQGTQGREIVLDDPEPTEDAVDGARLLDDIEALVRRHVVLPDNASVPLVLWAVHSYCMETADVAPLLVFTSPVKRSGKSTALECVRRLVRRPLSASTISSSALFRTIEKAAPTLLIDEADSLFKENEELRCLVNAGFTRTAAFAVRCVGEDQEPRSFSTWAAKCLALIGSLPPTLADRSITVKMRRKPPGQSVERLRAGEDHGFGEVRRRVARFVRDTAVLRDSLDPPVPHELNDRQADCWRELLRIADAAGGSWPSRARSAAMAVAGGDEDEEDARTLLLHDLREHFEATGWRPRYSSAELVLHLGELDGRPWPEWSHGKGLTAHGMAKLLRGFGIGSKLTRIDGRPARSYESADFAESFRLYLAGDAPQPEIRPERNAMRPLQCDGRDKGNLFTANEMTSACNSVTLKKGSEGDGALDAVRTHLKAGTFDQCDPGFRIEVERIADGGKCQPGELDRIARLAATLPRIAATIA